MVQKLAVSSRRPLFQASSDKTTPLVGASQEQAATLCSTEVAPIEVEDLQAEGAQKREDNSSSKSCGFAGERYIAANFTAKDIIGGVEATRSWETDKRDNPISRYFQISNTCIGLTGDDFLELYRLAERIQKLPGWRDAVSIEALVEYTFDWLRLRYLEQQKLPLAPSEAVPLFCDALLTFFNQQIKPQEVWVPLEGMEIESDFAFGRAELRTITVAMMDRWRQDWESWALKHPERAEGWAYEFELRRTRLQGLTAVCLRLEAEPKRAVEVAYREAERTVAMLRCLSPSVYFPDAITRIALAGWEGDRGREHYFVKEGAIDHFGTGRRNPEIDNKDWRLSNTEREEMRVLGWNETEGLLRDDKLNELEKLCLEALLTYSRSAVVSALPDKLLYVLTALETVLLPSDDIVPHNLAQQVVGEGIALLNGKSLSQRKEILVRTRTAYELRHALLRREETRDELESLHEFFFHARLFFVYLVQNLQLKTKKAFLNALEIRKLRGGLEAQTAHQDGPMQDEGDEG